MQCCVPSARSETGRCPERVIWCCEQLLCNSAVLSVVVEESAARACAAGVFLLLACYLTRKQPLYFFERKEPDSVRPELGRCARPGFASFQVLTRTLCAQTCQVSISGSLFSLSSKHIDGMRSHLCVLSAYSSASISFTPTFSPPSFVKVMFFFSMCFWPRSASSLLQR